MPRSYDGFDRPLPSEVPGYAEAATAGLLPRVPAEPPALLPGTTAIGHLRRRVLIFVIAFALAVVLSKTLPTGVGNTAGGVVLAAGMIWFFLGLPWLARRTMAEARAGYATSTVLYSQANTGRARYAARGVSGRVGWNFDGVWYLKPDGSVIRPAAPDVLAPGFYPSPNRPGTFELWTGKAWNGRFRSAEQVRAGL